MKQLILAIAFIFMLAGCTSNEVQLVPEAQAQGSIRQLFTDSIETAGATKKIHFHFQFELSRDWHYFGTTAAEIPPAEAGAVFEHAEIQFPRDFAELGDEEDELLFDLALIAGLNREGLE